MSGDIEDFLRRAAQRRQARQANNPPSAAPPTRPEYSDARRERMPQVRDDDDELVIAEVVEEPLSRKLAELKRAQASAQAMREATTRAERQRASESTHGLGAQRLADRPSVPPPGQQAMSASRTSQAPGPDVQSVAIGDLHESLRSAQGLRSAILLHEILDRPVHRWQ
jgi:hypothetical protein